MRRKNKTICVMLVLHFFSAHFSVPLISRCNSSFTNVCFQALRNIDFERRSGLSLKYPLILWVGRTYFSKRLYSVSNIQDLERRIIIVFKLWRYILRFLMCENRPNTWNKVAFLWGWRTREWLRWFWASKCLLLYDKNGHLCFRHESYGISLSKMHVHRTWGESHHRRHHSEKVMKVVKLLFCVF